MQHPAPAGRGHRAGAWPLAHALPEMQPTEGPATTRAPASGPCA